MPDDFLRRYSARQISEVMAYYRIKAEDDAHQRNKTDIEMQRRARRRGVRG